MAQEDTDLDSLLRDLTNLIREKPSIGSIDKKQTNPNNSFGQSVLSNAQADLGVREDLGRNDGKRIRQYFKLFGMGAKQDWCAAAVSYWMKEAGGGPISGGVGVRSIVGQLSAANRWISPDKILSTPEALMPGNIVAWARGGPDSGKGHIGVIESFDGGGNFVSIEANSGPHSDSVVRNSHSINDPNLLGIGLLSNYTPKKKELSAHLLDKASVFLKLSTKI